MITNHEHCFRQRDQEASFITESTCDSRYLTANSIQAKKAIMFYRLSWLTIKVVKGDSSCNKCYLDELYIRYWITAGFSEKTEYGWSRPAI